MATDPLQHMRKTVEDRLLPAFAENGFEPDPTLLGAQGWNGTGYDWFLIHRMREDILLRTHLWVAPSHDPALSARTDVFELADPSLSDEAATRHFQDLHENRPAPGPLPGWQFADYGFPYLSLSPWRPWSAVGFGILNQWLYTEGLSPGAKVLRYATFPALFLVSALLVPVNLIALPLSLRWSKSRAIRSGARQARIAEMAARAVPKILPRIEARLARVDR